MNAASMTIGTIIDVCLLIIVSWVGFKKSNNRSLWLGFVPLFSIIHAILGWYILALAFQYDSKPEQFPLFASILAPTYSCVILFGYPLEAIGLGDDLAYSIAFGLNAICISLIIAFIVQWIKRRKSIRSYNKVSNP